MSYHVIVHHVLFSLDKNPMTVIEMHVACRLRRSDGRSALVEFDEHAAEHDI